MTDQEIAAEIAKLMGRTQWIVNWPLDTQTLNGPMLGYHAHCGIIEGWCRERGVWILLDGDQKYRVFKHGPSGISCPAEPCSYNHNPWSYPEALLEAVRLAAEVEK